MILLIAPEVKKLDVLSTSYKSFDKLANLFQSVLDRKN